MKSRLARLAALVLTLLVSRSASAQTEAETLEVTFDLAQYQHNGNFSFSQGCISTPPTGRNNYVHLTVVWIEDDQGNYVTTLYRWGRTYLYNLKAWATASDMAIDGITSATPTSNGNNPGQVFRNFSTGAQDISWLPDGNYTIHFESTQCELADEYRSGTTPLFGPTASFAFTKGRTAQTNAMLGSTAPFNNVRVNYAVPGMSANAPPGAYAGPDVRLMPSVTPSESSGMLDGTVSDESGTPSVMWTLVDTEPAGLTATIVSPTSAQTQVDFTTAGIYTFRLTATDSGGATSSDDVEVWVNAYELEATHDAEVARGQPNVAMGIIENSGPWVFSWGQCNAGENYSRGYHRFDLTAAGAAIVAARLRLPYGEATPNTNIQHDFYILSDAQDDWNGNDNSTDWEASLTFNNQSVPQGRATNLDPGQLAGSFTHWDCRYRHSFNDPIPPEAPATDCPAWVDVDIDIAAVNNWDSNDEWSFFSTPRQGCNSGMGVGSRENLIGPKMVVVEFWQSTMNQAPTANAGPDRVVTDVLPAGSEMVTLDGSASTDDSGIVSYDWREGGTLLGSSAMPAGVTVPMSLGIHDIELTVTDGAGLTGTDNVEIVVEDRFYPNHDSAEAATIDGDAAGRLYEDLYAYAATGDWYAIDVVEGTDVTVSIDVANGDLDLALLDAQMTEIDASSSGNTVETVNGTSLAAGRYLVRVDATAPSSYSMTVTVAGPTVSVTLNPASAVESAGTLTGAGTVSISDAAMSAIDVTLMSSNPSHLSFVSNTVTIEAGMTSATFDIVLVDDPMGAPDENRYVDITATAMGFNRGSATFEILDDEQSLTVNWDKAAETIDETRSPLVVLTAEASGTPSQPITIPFTLGGDAVLGEDYRIMGMVTELQITGTPRTTLVIELIDDEEVEGDETLTVTMGTPTGANPGTVTEFVLTIGDDDTNTNPDPNPMPMGMNDDDGGGCNCRTESGEGPAPWGLLLLLGLGLRRRQTRTKVTDGRF